MVSCSSCPQRSGQRYILRAQPTAKSAKGVWRDKPQTLDTPVQCQGVACNACPKEIDASRAALKATVADGSSSREFSASWDPRALVGRRWNNAGLDFLCYL